MGKGRVRWDDDDDDEYVFGDLEPPAEALGVGEPPLNVLLSSHAARQITELGRPAEQALAYLGEMTLDDIMWSAQALPPQQGREVWLLWAGSVRVLFDVEDGDLTVQGFGLRPPF
jgi:hypothetical protein